jgi:Xaa-Pro aminopeptidase
MANHSERINGPVSTKELERRWSAVRAAMDERGIDVLLMQNNNDFMGGNVKYFTDNPAVNGYPVIVVFPKEDDMTVVTMGPFGTDRQLPPGGDWYRRGVKRHLAVPSFASAHYTAGYEVEATNEALKSYGGATIGLLTPATMAFALVDGLKRGRLSNASFVDASDMVDRIKCIKSEEELAWIRKTAEIQDGALDAAFKAIRPGMREIEVGTIAEKYIHDHGGEQGIFLACSITPGEPVRQDLRHLQNRVIRAGDLFTLLVETNGPGGQYTEIGRVCSVGKAADEDLEEHEFVLQARRFTLARMKPGTPCKDIFLEYNEFLRENGRPLEGRLYCHGQGCDLVERPLIRQDEPMRIEKNMNIACHPNWVNSRMFATICDNYLIHHDGPSERIHKYPEKLMQL